MYITKHLITNLTIPSTTLRKNKHYNAISLDCRSIKRAFVSYQIKTTDTVPPRSVPYSTDTFICDEHLSKDDVTYQSVLKQAPVIASTKLFNCVDKDPYTAVKSLTSYSSHLHENLDSAGTSDTKKILFCMWMSKKMQ